MKIINSFQKISQHSLFRSSLIYTLTDAVNKSIPFFLLPVLTHYLLPAEFGIATNFNVFVSILTIFIGVSIQGAISVNYHKLETRELKSYIGTTILIISFLFLIIITSVFIFQRLIFQFLPIDSYYIVLACFMAYFQSIVAINLTIWQLEGKPVTFGIYGIILTILNIGLSLIFVIYFEMGWKGRVDGSIIATCLCGAFSFFAILNRSNFRIGIKKKYIQDALLFSLPLIPHGLSIWIRSGIDRIYITHFLGDAANGIYATAFQFGLLISFITLAFNNAYVPYLYKNLSNSDDFALARFKNKIVKFTYLYFFILLLFGGIMIFIAYFVINNFLSEKYIDTKSYVPLIMLSQVFQGMYLMVANYIFYAKKTKYMAIITFTCSILQVLFSYVLIKDIGAIGAAYSTVIVSFINFVAVWCYSYKAYKMPWFSHLNINEENFVNH
jgi:O-antigen/teichoic acid export membrane protein